MWNGGAHHYTSEARSRNCTHKHHRQTMKSTSLFSPPTSFLLRATKAGCGAKTQKQHASVLPEETPCSRNLAQVVKEVTRETSCFFSEPWPLPPQNSTGKEPCTSLMSHSALISPGIAFCKIFTGLSTTNLWVSFSGCLNPVSYTKFSNAVQNTEGKTPPPPTATPNDNWKENMPLPMVSYTKSQFLRHLKIAFKRNGWRAC